MEELRSTEALTNEIRNEARKNAAKIVEKAGESAKLIEESVDERFLKAKEDALKLYDSRLALFEKNASASVPLEKERYLVSFIYGRIMSALNEYFDSLGEDKRLDIVMNSVERSKFALENKDIDAKIIGFDEKKAKKLLSKIFGKSLSSCTVGSVHEIEDESVDGFNFREGLVLSANDGSVVCRLTLDEKVKEIMDDKSYEIATALFAGRLPQ